jgi:hypothetical protein
MMVLTTLSKNCSLKKLSTTMPKQRKEAIGITPQIKRVAQMPKLNKHHPKKSN